MMRPIGDIMDGVICRLRPVGEKRLMFWLVDPPAALRPEGFEVSSTPQSVFEEIKREQGLRE